MVLAIQQVPFIKKEIIFFFYIKGVILDHLIEWDRTALDILRKVKATLRYNPDTLIIPQENIFFYFIKDVGQYGLPMVHLKLPKCFWMHMFLFYYGEV